MSSLAPKRSDIKIKLVLKIIWPFITSFCMYLYIAQIKCLSYLRDYEIIIVSLGGLGGAIYRVSWYNGEVFSMLL